MLYTTCKAADTDPLDLGYGPLPFYMKNSNRMYDLKTICDYLGLKDPPQRVIEDGNAIRQTNVLWLCDVFMPLSWLEPWLRFGTNNTTDNVSVYNRLMLVQYYDKWNPDPDRDSIFWSIYKPSRKQYLIDTQQWEGSKEQQQENIQKEREAYDAWLETMRPQIEAAKAEWERLPEVVAFRKGLPPPPKRVHGLTPEEYAQRKKERERNLTPEQKEKRAAAQRARRNKK